VRLTTDDRRLTTHRSRLQTCRLADLVAAYSFAFFVSYVGFRGRYRRGHDRIDHTPLFYYGRRPWSAVCGLTNRPGDRNEGRGVSTSRDPRAMTG
jgi:hypothetical protein